ncbi:MAG: hypothetical protein BAA04_09490 [Firmicutes bacterium ZCTH02-B6]|nr:MAG: hypothetical protein BAA04_09490 [Firmicutes bacterium ZCTH02-B6]
MAKIDLKKELKELYQASPKEARIVDVPPMAFLMIDGSGDPNTSPDYARAVETLFAVSYTAKFMVKKSDGGIDYAVMPLEGLWWADDWAAFVTGDRARWQWTMMIMQPDFVPEAVIRQAMDKVSREKPGLAVDKLRLERWEEGRAAQILHVGPFSEEGPTIRRLHEFIQRYGRLRGRHHEIYLSDVRRAAPERWRTILRQPME